MGGLFHLVLKQPLYNLLIWLYDVIPGADMGVAIIALTLVVKLILWPLTHSSLVSQKALQDLQPKLDALKAEHGADKEKLAKATMELYAKEKVNPLSSCLPVLLQLPVLIALYSVLSTGLTADGLVDLYPFVRNPGSINEMFAGFLDLTAKSIPLALLTGAATFVQTKMLMAKRPPKPVTPGAKDEDMLAAMNKSMTYTMPVVTAVIGAGLPAGLLLYWLTNTLASIAQQAIAFRKKS
ncbi:hypothetical protein A2856_00235 [Candidatus Uhrbacteria bacterium RIFCSPHIGHO2_01_FULL_63_20]|uniref:Membrane insertase YidC/Oxa/ALB C-terminal domain-containing protein n=1 Tax=Candidatus Uhrbacteria bacterium RIFCSPHIGHO2_01_FULL_63_20 TaxID=1802385 RepID=A0A1F7TLR8_9BACT|nr:MAG: hypothetical protein A2856_00235 [Candidatus Uhrbacteria bacterium RIFCSPHIGHO2_01_FULL_63_20]